MHCSCVCSSRGRRSVATLSLLCLLDSWSLICSSFSSNRGRFVARPSVRIRVARLSVRIVVTGLLVRRWCVVGVSLTCRSSICSCIVRALLVRWWSVTRLSLVYHWSVTRLSAPVVAVGPSLLCRCSVYWSHGRWLAHPWLVCCSCVIDHGRRSATHAPLVCLLFPAARLPVALPLVVSTAGPPLLCLLVCLLVRLLVRRWSG